MTCFF